MRRENERETVKQPVYVKIRQSFKLCRTGTGSQQPPAFRGCGLPGFGKERDDFLRFQIAAMNYLIIGFFNIAVIRNGTGPYETLDYWDDQRAVFSFEK